MYLIHQSGPVVGWRFWSLTSPNSSGTDCFLDDALDSSMEISKPWSLRIVRDRGPDEGEKFSIQETNSPDGYWEKSALAPLSHTLDIMNPNLPTVCGQVIGWGTIKETERGWWATNIYPFRLGLICWDCLRDRGILWPPQQVLIFSHFTGVHPGVATCSQHALERMHYASLDRIPIRSIPARTVEADLLAKYAISRADLPTLEEDPLLFLNEMEGLGQ